VISLHRGLSFAAAEHYRAVEICVVGRIFFSKDSLCSCRVLFVVFVVRYGKCIVCGKNGEWWST